jgi:hypothetical protein
LKPSFSGLISYGQSADLLAETLPLGRILHATTVRRHAQASTSTRHDRAAACAGVNQISARGAAALTVPHG